MLNDLDLIYIHAGGEMLYREYCLAPSTDSHNGEECTNHKKGPIAFMKLVMCLRGFVS